MDEVMVRGDGNVGDTLVGCAVSDRLPRSTPYTRKTRMHVATMICLNSWLREC